MVIQSTHYIILDMQNSVSVLWCYLQALQKGLYSLWTFVSEFTYTTNNLCLNQYTFIFCAFILKYSVSV